MKAATCRRCGVTIFISAKRALICGNCGNALDPSEIACRREAQDWHKILRDIGKLVLFLSMLVGVVLVVDVVRRDASQNAKPAVKQTSMHPITDEQRLPRPAQSTEEQDDGEVHSTPASNMARPSTGFLTYPPEQSIAPLNISTTGSNDFFVRLVDTSSSYQVIKIYIRGGDTFSGRMPIGSYELRYAIGSTWHGEDEAFGSNTLYQKSSEILSFRENDTGYSGYSIKLYKIQNGNLHTNSIQSADFFR